MRSAGVATLACLLFFHASAGASDGGFAAHPEALRFVDRMVSEHGFDREALMAELSQARYQQKAIRFITPAKHKGVRSWERYRSRFVEPIRLKAGLSFWDTHAEALARAEQQYGVPQEIILGILGVETIYGRNTGAFPLVGALATLAFDYPPRAELFRKELEQLFLLARESGRQPSSFTGSYAGAIGFPQFLPSSIRAYAVDFDEDGRIDLEGSASDAIGSVARYLAEHGWQQGARIADPVHLPAAADPRALVEAGIEPSLDPSALAAVGLALPEGITAATLVDLESPGKPVEYWLGYRNFYVLTRYNRSSFYAMAVFHLANALRDARRAPSLAASGPPGR